MALTSSAAALVISAVISALVPAATASQLPAAAAAAEPPIGLLPNCSTNCGNLRVPYPFGIEPGCYRPGFNLTCDLSYGSPRLLLGDGSLRVVDIFIQNATVRVLQNGPMLEADNITITDGQNVAFAPIFAGGRYRISMLYNRFVVVGCNVTATFVTSSIGGNAINNAANCAAFCDVGGYTAVTNHRQSYSCPGNKYCCEVPSFPVVDPFHMLTEVQLRPLVESPIKSEGDHLAASVLVSENDPVTNNPDLRRIGNPLILRWDIMQGKALSENDFQNCGHCRRVAASHCKANNSEFTRDDDDEVFMCRCKQGYDGNPYLVGGCQDIDECRIPTIRSACFGYCNNLPGSHECRCPPGTHGDPYQLNGCTERNITSQPFISTSTSTNSGLTIGMFVATLLLFVTGAIFASRKVKQHQIKLLKRKHFEQNRGKLLQQLVSQRADIAEKMIMPVDELAKATNNFDKSRKLDGGGHGTVYKGILSDQHVVAIKKSKIVIQKEIYEFINEVAILSQVNHRNVVKLLGCCLETEVPLLVYEFISNGTLYHHLHVEGPKSLSWATRMRIATETANALAYLHSSVSIPIIHRDIKSTNILLDDNLTSKVSDFGASRYIPVDKTGLTTIIQETIGYLDPMCFCTGRLNEKSDVYSFGVILVELLTRKKPFYSPSSNGDSLVTHFAKLHAEGNHAEILDPQVIEEGGTEVEEVATLATLCTKLSGDDRPTMRQVEHTLQGLQAPMPI